MTNGIFSIDKFNVIQDEENYYFFRALNKADNNDLESGIITNEIGEIIRIRTDRERYEEDNEPKYHLDDKITLKEVNDHIKMRQRKDTNCISLSSNANVSVTYGRGSYSDRYIMVKVPKKEMGEKVKNAGSYMIEEIEKRVNEAIFSLNPENSEDILESLKRIDNAETEEQLKDINKEIEGKYTLTKTYKKPRQRTEKIALAMPRVRTSSYQSLSEEQAIEKSKIISKLTLLTKKHIMEPIFPHTSGNNNLLQTLGNAFSSCEQVHYGEIERESIIDISKEIVDIFALLQQTKEAKAEENKIDDLVISEIEKEIIDVITNKKQIEISSIPLNVEQEKKEISIEEMYELTNGRISYQMADSIIKKMFYLSKSKLRAKELSRVINEITGGKPEYQEVIRYIEENGFGIEPEIITRQSNKGYRISESVNLNLHKNELELIPKVQKLTETELTQIYENGGLSDIQGIITETFQEETNKEISKERYYAEAILASYSWEKAGIGEFSVTQRNEILKKLEEQNCVELYEKLKNTGIPSGRIPKILFNIISQGRVEELLNQENYSELIEENQEELNQNISVEQLETFLGYYDVKGTNITLRDYQQIAVNKTDELLDERHFASVILPTGAGKSFVALAELYKYKNEKLLYLAPSNEILEQIQNNVIEYIHGTKGTIGKSKEEIIREIFPNLNLTTYSSLLGIKGKEYIESNYDFIVLDELHRTGAEQWEQKLNKLLENQDSNTKVLGITATPERDMDQRNMADEMAEKFGYTKEEIEEGKHIAENMNLIDAIRLGIVANPKVVSCEYTLKTDGSMEKLLESIQAIENEDVRNEKINQYEKLRKSLDKAKGIPELLKENVRAGGRYIVFIPVTDKNSEESDTSKNAGEQKIKESEAQITKWFEGSEISLEIYSMLGIYGDRKNSAQLQGFESSQSSNTKFMIAMNKLNEGIHVKDVDGIIWLRALDRNSRILCLQQLGRIMHSSNEKDDKRPVVIDIANNLLNVRLNEEINQYTVRDDLELLRDIAGWIEIHNGYIPDINSTSRQEQRYGSALKRIQEKYEKYLEGYEDLDEDEIKRVTQIIEVGEEIDLWNMQLPSKIKSNGKDEDVVIEDFEVTGILRDYLELDNDREEISAAQTLARILRILKDRGVDISNIKLGVQTIEDLLKAQNIEEGKREEIEEELKKIGKEMQWDIGKKLTTQKGPKYKEKFTEALEKAGFDEASIEELTGRLRSEDATQEMVEVLKILRDSGMDISNIKTGGQTIEDLLKAQSIDKEKIVEIAEELKEIGKEMQWKIGKKLSNQKSRDKKKFTEALEKAGFDKASIEALIGSKLIDATQEMVKVLKILRDGGVDISDIKTGGQTIEDLLKAQNIEEEKREKIEEELKKIGKEMQWNIGNTLSNQKGQKNKEKFTKALKKAGFDEASIEALTGRLIAEDTTREMVGNVIKILKDRGVDISNIKLGVQTIEDLLKAQNIEGGKREEIEEELKKIGKEMQWDIGTKFKTQKRNDDNKEKFIEALEKAGFDKASIEALTGRLRAEDATQEMVNVLKILRDSGVDISNIKTSGQTIEDLLKAQNTEEGKREEIEEELKEIGKEMQWDIGTKLKLQKRPKNKEKFTEALEKAGFDEAIIKALTENKKEKLTALVEESGAKGKILFEAKELEREYEKAQMKPYNGKEKAGAIDIGGK